VVAGACAAVTAGAACACVDFPLARPTELAWWWVALALTFQTAHAAVDRGRTAANPPAVAPPGR
jgi:hypothetical protein